MDNFALKQRIAELIAQRKAKGESDMTPEEYQSMPPDLQNVVGSAQVYDSTRGLRGESPNEAMANEIAMSRMPDEVDEEEGQRRFKALQELLNSR